MASAVRLGPPRLEAFGRCVVLRAAQWALDGRSGHTTVDEFRGILATSVAEMVEGARDLRAAVKASGRRSTIKVINRTAAGIEDDERMRDWSAPRLVVTSPPYPGVHVLYAGAKDRAGTAPGAQRGGALSRRGRRYAPTAAAGRAVAIVRELPDVTGKGHSTPTMERR